jgi:hypothetical protein
MVDDGMAPDLTQSQTTQVPIQNLELNPEVTHQKRKKVSAQLTPPESSLGTSVLACSTAVILEPVEIEGTQD